MPVAAQSGNDVQIYDSYESRSSCLGAMDRATSGALSRALISKVIDIVATNIAEMIHQSQKNA